MIKTFSDKHTEKLYVSGKSTRLPPDVISRAKRKLDYIDFVTSLKDLRVPPGNRLHKLSGDRDGQHAVAINDQWRICFRFEHGNAYEVEITDYHSG